MITVLAPVLAATCRRPRYATGGFISGFETDPDAVFLLIPVLHGREHAIGDRVTITFEENR